MAAGKMSEQALHAQVRHAREQLKDIDWVAWAYDVAGDNNEGALATAYQAIDELARRLGL